MNSYNFIRSFNFLTCTNSFLNKQATNLKQPLLQYVNFLHTCSYDTGILHRHTENYNKSLIPILSSDRLRYTNSNYRHFYLMELNINKTQHTFTNVTKNFVFKHEHKNFSNDLKDTPSNIPITRKEKLKRAVKEYGSTVIIFHVTISLMSLGGCYLLVSSGIDLASILSSLGISGSIATNAGTFVTAYAIHKVFAPVRISITLGATPFIVRYLRRIGFLKAPKNP